MFIDFGQMLSKSLELYKNNLKTYLQYILLSASPYVMMAGALLLASLISTMPASDVTTPPTPRDFIGLGIVVVSGIAVVILSIWFNVAFVRVANALYNKQSPVGMAQAIKDAKALLWKSISVSILSGLTAGWPLFLALFLGLVATVLTFAGAGSFTAILSVIAAVLGLVGVVYGFYMSVRLVFSLYSVVLDNAGAKEALKKSASLVQGRWWGIFSRIFVTALVIGLSVSIIGGLINVVLYILKMNPDTSLLSAIFKFILQMLSAPLFLNCIVILYCEAKRFPAPSKNPPTSTPTMPTPAI